MPSPTHRHSLKSEWRHGAFMSPLTLIFTFFTTPQSFRTPIYMTNNFSKFYFSSLWRKWRQKIKYNKQRNNLIIAHLMSFVCKLLKELERLVGGWWNGKWRKGWFNGAIRVLASHWLRVPRCVAEFAFLQYFHSCGAAKINVISGCRNFS